MHISHIVLAFCHDMFSIMFFLLTIDQKKPKRKSSGDVETGEKVTSLFLTYPPSKAKTI